MGGNGPLVVMDDADLDSRGRGDADRLLTCAPARAAPPASGILVHAAVKDEFVELLARARDRADPARRPVRRRRRRWARSTTSRSRSKMDEHVADALERGASVVGGGARADRLPDVAVLGADDPRPTSRPTPASPSRRHSDRSRRWSRSTRSSRRSSSPTPPRTACWRRSSPPISHAGLEFADRVRTGWVNINESSNYWEAHLPFGGRAGTDSGIGRVGGAHVMHSFTELQTVVLTPPRWVI